MHSPSALLLKVFGSGLTAVEAGNVGKHVDLLETLCLFHRLVLVWFELSLLNLEFNMLVITCIQLLLEIGDMIPLVILLVWPPLHFITFKVLSRVSSHLIAAEREFLIDKGTAVFPLHFLSFNSCGTWEARSTASGGFILLAQPLGLVCHPGPQSGAVFISWLERNLGRLLPLLLFSISDVSNRFGFLLCVFVEPEKVGGQIWRTWGAWECGLNLGARVELFCPPNCGKPGFGSCAQPYLVSLFQ